MDTDLANGCVVKVHGVMRLYRINPFMYRIPWYVTLSDPGMQCSWIDKQTANLVHYHRVGKEVCVVSLYHFHMVSEQTMYDIIHQGQFRNFVRFAMCKTYPDKFMSKLVSLIFNTSEFSTKPSYES